MLQMDDLLATDARGRPDETMSQLIVYYSDKQYSRIKYFFEQYYGLNYCHIVYRNSGTEISRHTLVKRWKLHAAVQQVTKQALVHRSATKFLKRWMQDPTAEIIDVDGCSISKLPQFQSFARVPSTYEGLTIELGYELQNLNKLVQYMYHNFVTPNFSQSHPVYKAVTHLHSTKQYILRSQLDALLTARCFRNGIDTINADEVFDELHLAELHYSRVFCGNEMILPRLIGSNWKHHPKKRPFPNCFSPVARKYVDGLLLQYSCFLKKVQTYVERYGTPEQFRDISKQVSVLQGQVDIVSPQY